MFLCLNVQAATSSIPDKAREMVQKAIAAMGGETVLRPVKTIETTSIEHLNWVEQSERPKGPYFVSYEQTHSFLDLDNRKSSQTVESKNLQTLDWTTKPPTYVVENAVSAVKTYGKTFPFGVAQVKETEMRIVLGPERILLTALDSKDLRLERDVVLQSVPHHVIKFTWQAIPVTIFLNANTNLPTAVETVSAFPNKHFWTVWGDVPTRIYYSYWTLEANGLCYPYQWDVQRLGLPLRSISILKLRLNPAIPADVFTIPETVAMAFKQNPQKTIDELPLGVPDQSAKEIASGIVQITGRWNVAFVKQKDGIVIIEAPVSSAYSAKVLAEAKRRFPDLPVKAVITTADSFPHIGGIREYAVRGIPIYALDVNRPILERMLAAPREFYPDSLQIKPHKANFKIVSNKTIIGEGENHLEIYPIRSEAGERLLMIYLPERKILYAADLVQKNRDGSFFMPEYLAELVTAVRRENLPIEKVFAMHSESLAWSEIESAVDKQIQ